MTLVPPLPLQHSYKDALAGDVQDFYLLKSSTVNSIQDKSFVFLPYNIGIESSYLHPLLPVFHCQPQDPSSFIWFSFPLPAFPLSADRLLPLLP